MIMRPHTKPNRGRARPLTDEAKTVTSRHSHAYRQPYARWEHNIASSSIPELCSFKPPRGRTVPLVPNRGAHYSTNAFFHILIIFHTKLPHLLDSVAPSTVMTYDTHMEPFRRHDEAATRYLRLSINSVAFRPQANTDRATAACR
jgi:hypothetical protein